MAVLSLDSLNKYALNKCVNENEYEYQALNKKQEARTRVNLTKECGYIV